MDGCGCRTGSPSPELLAGREAADGAVASEMSEKPFIEARRVRLTELQIIDEVVGDGPEASRGSTVDVDYVGVG